MNNICRVIGVFAICFTIISCKQKDAKAVGHGDKGGSEQPNIILFLVDDMGWQDTSVPFWTEKTAFNERYKTPNMERLAKEGMKFTQAYATSVCSPTRISLMTGMNAARHRVTNWTLKKDMLQPVEVNHKKLKFPRWNVNGMSPIPDIKNAVYATPLPNLLQEAGYYTIHAGKAHFGAIGTPAENPKRIGFDVNIAGHAAGAPESYLGTENFGNGEKGKEIWAVPGLEKYHGEDIFLTEALTKEAILAMDSAVVVKKPFFLYMAHYAVHTPLYGDNRFEKKYLDARLDPKEAKYASMVEGMDKSLGDLMNYLNDKGIADNTIILFMSDNGGLSAVARGGQPHTHNKPLSSGKGSAHEGGIREPMIVKWPGVTQENSSTSNYVIIEDFFPTILEISRIEKYKAVQTIDGKSFVSILKSKEVNNNERPLFWHYPNNWGQTGPGIGATSSIRKGDYKLIYYHIDSHFELFNIEEDIGETNNLASTEKEKLKALAVELGDYLRGVNAQMPTRTDTNQQVPWPDAEEAIGQIINKT
ncbi:sulfatase [Aestuariivivens marinum]|uniref:sulfatase n=1 Tax=Aestuariivivens marinum TaxID=2913555 RepID=UPI001F5AD8B2|nr:sulfatase [Aestuariivivens marinum]